MSDDQMMGDDSMMEGQVPAVDGEEAMGENESAPEGMEMEDEGTM